MNTKVAKFLSLALTFSPLIALAQNAPQFSYVETGLRDLLSIVETYLIPGAIAVGLMWFLWGLVSYIRAKDDGSRNEARSSMIHGIIALFVMVSVWGLVSLLQNITGVDTGNVPTVPAVPAVRQ